MGSFAPAPLSECPPLADGYTLTCNVDAELLEQVYALRVLAWRDRIAMAPDFVRWADAQDAVSRHWVILCGGRVVGACRYSLHDKLEECPDGHMFPSELAVSAPVAVSSLLVVDPDHRGKGLAKALDFLVVQGPFWEGAGVVLGSVGNAGGYEGRVSALESAGWTIGGRAMARSSQPYATENWPDFVYIDFGAHR